MLFHAKKQIKSAECFTFSGEVHATVHPCLNKPIFREFWHNFSCNASELCLAETDSPMFSVGDAQPIPCDGYEYTICVTPSGICLCASDEIGLRHGFVTLLDRFKLTEVGETLAVQVDCTQIWDKPSVANRMVHLCILPETDLWSLQRLIRFCGALKYTHVVLEFWGMLKYDCLKELAWPFAFSKDEIRPLIQEANNLGMEVIPMFNHWGHASAGRIMHGKHVVLDQNPSLQTYFSEDGWCWDIRKEKVKTLLRNIRHELIELCGNGSYFHIGCDEADNFVFTPENMNFVCDFINEINQELCLQNRRVIVWGDMFLYRYPHYNEKNRYTCNAPSAKVEQYLLEHLDRRIVIADWQYDATEAPIETVSVFQKAGFSCLLCPWDRNGANVKALISTVETQQLDGFIHTTWHTLSKGLPYVALSALYGFDGTETSPPRSKPPIAAAILRKVLPCCGDYKKAGWSKIEVGDLW